MFLRLFENFVKIPSIRPFLTGNKALFPSLSPSGKVARSADRGLFKISPYVAASPCFFLLSQKSAKIVSRYAASPRGEAPPRGGGEGRNLFSIRIISIKGCNLFVSLSFVSLLLSPSGKVARSADRGQPLSTKQSPL